MRSLNRKKNFCEITSTENWKISFIRCCNNSTQVFIRLADLVLGGIVNSKERYISKDTESKIVHWQKVNLDFELIIIALLQEKFEDLSLIPKYSISTLYNNFQTD